MKLKTTGKSAVKWAPQALRPLVSCILSPVSYKELNKLLSSFDFRCGLYLSADMSNQPMAV